MSVRGHVKLSTLDTQNSSLSEEPSLILTEEHRSRLNSELTLSSGAMEGTAHFVGDPATAVVRWATLGAEV